MSNLSKLTVAINYESAANGNKTVDGIEITNKPNIARISVLSCAA